MAAAEEDDNADAPDLCASQEFEAQSDAISRSDEGPVAFAATVAEDVSELHPSFKFSTEAMEFVPQDQKTFQFNPSANEFNPTGLKAAEDASGPSQAQIAGFVPVMAPSGVGGVYPVMALQAIRPPGGGRGNYAYMPVSNIGATGGAMQVVAVNFGPNLASYHDPSGINPNVRPMKGGKGGRQMYGQKGFGRSYGQKGGNAHHGLGHRDARSQDDSADASKALAGQAADTKCDEGEDEEEQDPSKMTWAQRLRAKRTNNAETTSHGPRKLPIKNTATPSIATPKVSAWGTTAPTKKAETEEDTSEPELNDSREPPLEDSSGAPLPASYDAVGEATPGSPCAADPNAKVHDVTPAGPPSWADRIRMGPPKAKTKLTTMISAPKTEVSTDVAHDGLVATLCAGDVLSDGRPEVKSRKMLALSATDSTSELDGHEVAVADTPKVKRDMIVYSAEFLRSLASAFGSQGGCPPGIPSSICCMEAPGYNECYSDRSPARYSVDTLKSLKDKGACQELPAGHRIPKDLQACAGLSPAHSPTNRGSPKSRRGGAAEASFEDDWRTQGEKWKAAHALKEKGARRNKGGRSQEPLHASETSWHAMQQAKKGDVDEEIFRKMKGILNKLTVEKFEALYEQLLHCGIETRDHVELLMREVFEKATMQHHFTAMYTELCIKLNDWLSKRRDIWESGVEEDGEKVSFKRILLNQCQDSFEKYLKPPEDLRGETEEDRFEAKVKYKTKMLGNIKFVAQLLINKVLSSKIIFSCIEELLSYSNEETLETLCAFLETIGPVFDRQDWKSYFLFNTVFDRVKQLTSSINGSAVPQRIQCLLKDVLDLRANGWCRNRPHNQPEGPMLLAEVQAQWARDHAEKDGVKPPAPKGKPQPLDGKELATPADDWETVPASKRPGKVLQSTPTAFNRSPGSAQASGLSSPLGSFNSPSESRRAPKSLQSRESWQRRPVGSEQRVSLPAEKDRPSLLTSIVTLRPGVSQSPAPAASSSEPVPSKEDFRQEWTAAIVELIQSRDLDEAVARVSAVRCPAEHQEAELCRLLARIVEARDDARPCLWQLAMRLFLEEEIWHKAVLVRGIDKFLTKTCADLECDVPRLPQILKDEFWPVLEKDGQKFLSIHDLEELRTRKRPELDS